MWDRAPIDFVPKVLKGSQPVVPSSPYMDEILYKKKWVLVKEHSPSAFSDKGLVEISSNKGKNKKANAKQGKKG